MLFCFLLFIHLDVSSPLLNEESNQSSMSEDLILPPGYINNGYLTHGGQALIYLVQPPPGARAQDSGFFSLKDGAASVPQTLVVRKIPNFDPQPQSTETEEEKKVRVRNLRLLAREVNVSIHFAAGHPFVDVIGIYTGRRINGVQKELHFIMPYYPTSLWGYVIGIREHEERYGRGPKLNEDVLRVIMVQLLAALAKMHSKGFAHRDATAANILLQNSAVGPLVYLADFGYSQLSGTMKAVYEAQAVPALQETNARAQETSKDSATSPKKQKNDNNDKDNDGYDPNSEEDSDEEEKAPAPLSAYNQISSKRGPYTAAGTIPFRAPESLFQYPSIDTTKLDIWAAGIDMIFCIFRGIDIIPGSQNKLFCRKSEVEQLKQIFSLIAPYDAALWESAANNLEKDLHSMLMNSPKRFIWHDRLLRSPEELSPECLEVLKAMLQPDPGSRPTASALLKYKWFSESPTASMLIKDIEKMQPPPNSEPLIDFTNKPEEEIRKYLAIKAPTIEQQE